MTQRKSEPPIASSSERTKTSTTRLLKGTFASIDKGIRRTLVRYLGPLWALYFLISALRSDSWHYYSLFAGIILALPCWALTAFFPAESRPQKTAIVYLGTGLAYTTIYNLTVQEGGLVTVLAASLVISYASLFSLRYLYAGIIGTFLSILLCEIVVFLSPYEMLSLAGGKRFVTLTLLSGMILPIQSFVLMRSQEISSRLIVAMEKRTAKHTVVITALQQAGNMLNAVLTQARDFSAGFAFKAEEQAFSLSRIKESVLTVRSDASAASDSAAEAKRISSTISERSADSLNRLTAVEIGFDRVVESTDVIREEFAALAERAESIVFILRMNREIAGQIKILAVNAGIQAAQAGQFGTGFRQVALQLKAMIQKTEESLSESRRLLEDIRTRARHSEETIRKGSNLLKKQFSALSSTRKQLVSIASGIASASKRVDIVTHSSGEQLERLEQTAVSISRLSTAANHLLATTGELIDTVDQISGSHDALRGALEQRSTIVTPG